MAKKKPVDNSRYAYSAGRIRALEARLIRSAQMERLIEARSAEDIARLLTDCGYPAAADPETSLKLGLEETYRLIRAISPEPRFVDALLTARDFHNLKVMLKAFSVYWPRRDQETAAKARPADAADDGGQPQAGDAGGAEIPQNRTALWPAIHGPVTYEQLAPLLQRPSTVDPQALFAALRARKPDGLPPALAGAAADAAAGYQQSYDIGEIDILIDKAQAQLLLDTARQLDIPFFTQYVSLRADLTNVGLLLRTRFLRSGADYLRHILLPGSSLAAADLAACYEGSEERIAALLAKTRLAPIVEDVAAFAAGGEAIARFGLASDNLLISQARRARMVLRGPDVLIAYLIAREMEIKSVRIILTCLRNRLPADKTRGLVRLTYL